MAAVAIAGTCKLKILIAEDNPIYRAVLQQHVERWGHEPVIANDGTQAWAVLRREDAPRLAILDWQMPGVDGIELCRRVKRDPEHPFTYVVMLTSRDAEEDVVKGLDAGADDYLTKPIAPALLKSRIRAAERIVKLVPPKEWSTPRIEGYDVKRLLGKGVFASVWEAVHRETDRTVALKIIRVDLATEDVFGRFAREIELMEKLNHPNIARIYDSQLDKTLGYYSMELVQGGTLESYVQEKKPRPGVLLYQFAKVCDALDHAHQQGVLHRDLKPSNVLMTEGGEPKVVDFGLARSLFNPSGGDSAVQSMDGSIIGTPLFMSPEQARGENDALDPRADVFALGIILFVMLIRQHPHKVKNCDHWETMRQIAQGRARRPREFRPRFDRELERIMMKALEHERGDRYDSAGDFGKTIRRYLDDRVQAAEDSKD